MICTCRVLRRQVDIGEQKIQETLQDNAAVRERLLIQAEESRKECNRLHQLLQEYEHLNNAPNYSSQQAIFQNTNVLKGGDATSNIKSRGSKSLPKDSVDQDNSRVSLSELEDIMSALSSDEVHMNEALSSLEQRDKTSRKGYASRDSFDDDNEGRHISSTNRVTTLLDELNLSNSLNSTASDHREYNVYNDIAGVRSVKSDRRDAMSDVAEAEKRLKLLVKKALG